MNILKQNTNDFFFFSRGRHYYCPRCLTFHKILDKNQIPAMQTPREEQSLGQTSFPIASTTEALSVPLLR